MTEVETLIYQPMQVRSEATLNRIVDAARALLDEKRFESIAVSEIMRKAGMSVGTFYTRFINKESLLPYIYERYDSELQKSVDANFRLEDWTGLNLSERIGRLVEICVKMYRSHRGLWRAMLMHACSKPEAISDTYTKRRRDMVKRIAALLLERSNEITHPDPKQAVEFSLILLFAACKEKILLAEGSHGTVRLSDKRLRIELTRSLIGYLTTGP